MMTAANFFFDSIHAIPVVLILAAGIGIGWREHCLHCGRNGKKVRFR